MAHFRNVTVRGTVYDFDHLRPHQFDIVVAGVTYPVEVRYSCHVFTQKRSGLTTPDLFYTHDGEKRAFCPIRYQQSLMLPNLISTHDGRSVYHSNQESYFWVNGGGAGSYYIFFRTFKPVKATKKRGVSVILSVRSAYTKQNEIKFAPAVKFSNLIVSAANGKKTPRGVDVSVRKRN